MACVLKACRTKRTTSLMRPHFVPTPLLRDDVPMYLHCNNCSGQNKKITPCVLCRSACDDQKVCLCHHQLHATWAYTIFSERVLWAPEADVQEDRIPLFDDLCEVYVRQSTPLKKVNVPQIVGTEHGMLSCGHTTGRPSSVDILQGSAASEEGWPFTFHHRETRVCAVQRNPG